MLDALRARRGSLDTPLLGIVGCASSMAEGHHNPRWTEKDLAQMRDRRVAGETLKSIAASFHVAQPTIRRALAIALRPPAGV